MEKVFPTNVLLMCALFVGFPPCRMSLLYSLKTIFQTQLPPENARVASCLLIMEWQDGRVATLGESRTCWQRIP